MRQGGPRIVGYLTFLGVLVATGGLAAAAPVTTCNAGTFVVDAGNAALVAQNGYNNSSCNLVIQATLPSGPMVLNLVITAKSIAITGNGGDVEIINTKTNSTIRFTAAAGNISLFKAVVKAHKTMNFKCTSPAGGPDCTFVADSSEIVVASDFALPLGCGGVLRIETAGDVTFASTFVHGGDAWEVFSTKGNIAIGPCGADGDGCTDPLLSKRPPQCFNAQGQFIGCTVQFTTENELRSVCFPPGQEQPCNGGCKEKRFQAKNGGIDITGTTITSKEHITFWCGPGGLQGAGSTILSDDKVLIDCTTGPSLGGNIDLTNATISGLNGPATAGTTLRTDPPSTITCTGGTFNPAPVETPPSATCP